MEINLDNKICKALGSIGKWSLIIGGVVWVITFIMLILFITYSSQWLWME